MNDIATKLGEDMYLAQEMKAMSQTYMKCIAREGLAGVEESNLTNASPHKDIAQAAYKTISKYFTGWSDNLNRELSSDFATAYLNHKP